MAAASGEYGCSGAAPVTAATATAAVTASVTAATASSPGTLRETLVGSVGVEVLIEIGFVELIGIEVFCGAGAVAASPSARKKTVPRLDVKFHPLFHHHHLLCRLLLLNSQQIEFLN